MIWENIKVLDFAEVITGGTPSTTVKEYWDNGNIAWLNSGELNQDVITQCENYITEKGLANSSARLMPKDTVLIALTGATTGVVGYLTFEACANQSVTGILPSNKHHPKFLYYYLKSIRNKVIADAYGGAQKHISQGYVKDLQIPLPPLRIQKRIADILDAADALKRKDQALLKKFDELAQAIFIDMFGDPVKNEKKWEVKTIKSSTNIITYGLTVRPQYIEEGIPLISARELRNGFVNYEDAPKISNTDFVKLSNKCKPQKGDILFSKTGSIGLSAIVDGSKEFAVTQNAARINFKNEFYETYFIYALLRQEAFINKCVTLVKGNAVKDLQLGDFSEIEIICPPIKLQKQFSEMSMQSNSLIKTSDNNSKASDSLFQTLIQKAFKGELVS